MECTYTYNAILFYSTAKIIKFEFYAVTKRGPSDAAQDISLLIATVRIDTHRGRGHAQNE